MIVDWRSIFFLPIFPLLPIFLSISFSLFLRQEHCFHFLFSFFNTFFQSKGWLGIKVRLVVSVLRAGSSYKNLLSRNGSKAASSPLQIPPCQWEPCTRLPFYIFSNLQDWWSIAISTLWFLFYFWINIAISTLWLH